MGKHWYNICVNWLYLLAIVDDVDMFIVAIGHSWAEWIFLILTLCECSLELGDSFHLLIGVLAD